MPMVEGKFRFLQMPIERFPGAPIDSGQPSFCKAPERFDPIDVIGNLREFILTVMDSKMLVASSLPSV